MKRKTVECVDLNAEEIDQAVREFVLRHHPDLTGYIITIDWKPQRTAFCCAVKPVIEFKEPEYQLPEVEEMNKSTTETAMRVYPVEEEKPF